MKHLDIQNLEFRRGNFAIKTALALDKGQTGVILGPSGSGKTTLLRLIAGLEHHQSGTISLGGRRIDELPPEKRNIGFVFQDLALFDHLDGRNNLRFGLKQHHVPESEIGVIVDSLSDKFQIKPLLSRRPWAMSGGERQRLACARALAVNPDLLLLDEPFSSLDAPLRRELRVYLRSRLAETGTTALHVTHDVEEAMELGDVLFLMNRGSIIVSGTPEEVCRKPKDAWSVHFLGLGILIPINSLASGAEWVSAECGNSGFSVLRSSCRINMEDVSNSPDGHYVSQASAPEQNYFLFCPLERLQLAQAQPQAKRSSCNSISGTIERIVINGSRKRATFKPSGLGLRNESSGPDGSALLFELELPQDTAAAPGDSISVLMPREDCWILPSHADTLS